MNNQLVWKEHNTKYNELCVQILLYCFKTINQIPIWISLSPSLGANCSIEVNVGVALIMRQKTIYTP